MLQVRVSSKAKRDVEAILHWLTEKSPQGAARWFNTYLATLRTLPDRAHSCSQAPEAAVVGRDLRQLLFKTRQGHTYRSLFLINGNIVHVLAVRGSGQDLVTEEQLGFGE